MEKSTFKRRLMFVVCMLMCGLSIQAADDGLGSPDKPGGLCI